MPTATDRLSRHRRVLSQVPGRIPGWSGRLRFRDRLSNPLPDDEGVFRVAGIEVAIFPSPQSDRQTRTYADPTNMVVVPVADCDDLSEAKVKCVGKRLHEFVETRLGQIPPRCRGGCDNPAFSGSARLGGAGLPFTVRSGPVGDESARSGDTPASSPGAESRRGVHPRSLRPRLLLRDARRPECGASSDELAGASID